MIILRKLSFWLALLGLCAAGALIARLRASISQPVPPPPIPAAAKPFEHCLGAAGLIEAMHENTLVAAPAPGRVERVAVKVWDEVKKGDLLFTLDSTDLRAALPTLQAQVQVAQAQLGRLKGQVERLEAVSDARAINLEELRLRRSDVEVAKAQATAASAALQHTLALIERLSVRAPIDGTVLQVNVRSGEYCSPASGASPMVLGDIKQMQVRADLDEQLAPRMKAGARAVATVRGDPARPIPLHFVRIEPFIIPKRSLTGSSIERVDTRVLQVIFSFEAPVDRPVYVGQQVDITIEEQP